MAYLYNLLIYQPLVNALIFFYNTVAFENLGLAIIFLTLLIRMVLFPLFHKSTRHQMMMMKLQPEVKKIQEKHKHDREKQTLAMMELYKEHNVNPFSGILLLIIQLPVLFALFQIFRSSFVAESLRGTLYGFVKTPAALNVLFLGLINLEQGSILMVGLAAVAQYFQAKLSLPPKSGGAPSAAERMSRQMVFVGPIFTLLIFYRLPAAVGLYWAVTSLFSVIQQLIINKSLKNGPTGNINQKTG